MAKQKTSMEKKAWRFYKSNLSLIVWDVDSDAPLADFSAGHFTTTDPRVAKRLADFGYPEIPLDAEFPPDILVSEKTFAIDGDVPLMRSTIDTEAIMEKKMQEAVTQTEDKISIPKVKEKPKEKKKSSLPKRRTKPKSDK